MDRLNKYLKIKKKTISKKQFYRSDVLIWIQSYRMKSIIVIPTYRQKILPFIYIYKLSFLISGGYLAAKTRHVHISALNDSKFIVWSIYIVVLTSLFTVIVMILIQNIRTYIVLCFVVIIVTSVIICLVFLPKVIDDRP